MAYSDIELKNLGAIKDALEAASSNFSQFFEDTFASDVEWTIAGHGPVARTYRGMNDLWSNAEEALYSRLAEPLRISTLGVWADGDLVFARIESSSKAIDGELYNNAYMYIMTVRDGKVVSGIEWLDLHAYYEIVERVTV